MTDILWTRSKRCETNTCPEWYIDADGALHVRDNEHPETELVLPRADAVMFVDAARRGEVYPYGR